MTLLKGMHKQHIIPRYLGGNDDPSNLVLLDPIDHAIWHLVRYKMYGNIVDLRSANLLMGKIDGSKFGDDRSGVNNPNYVRKHTPEACAKISAARKGCKRDPEVVARISAKNTGQKRPKQSIAMSGSNNPNYGKPMSEETKAKMIATKKMQFAAKEN